jgi:putative ABC transport system permease protein
MKMGNAATRWLKMGEFRVKAIKTLRCRMNALWQDVKFSVRMLAKNPGFTLTAVATLALAIGANTALFSVLDPLLLRKLPVQHPEQLVLVHAAGSLGSENIAQFSAYDIYSKSRVFSGVMAYNFMGGFDIVRNGTRLSADGAFVTGTYFPVLGVRPIVGRLIAPGDDEGPNGGAVTVLSFDYWRRAFNADENVIGQTLSTGDLSFAIRGLCVGDANDYALTEHPGRSRDRIKGHRDVTRVEQAIQL